MSALWASILFFADQWSYPGLGFIGSAAYLDALSVEWYPPSMGCEGEVSCVSWSGELGFVFDCDSAFSSEVLE